MKSDSSKVLREVNRSPSVWRVWIEMPRNNKEETKMKKVTLRVEGVD